jgi:HD-GYP domain-containing protein (c-di-GMP phosphodiesterase class II)
MFDSFQIHPVSYIKAMSQALEFSSVGISQHHFRTAVISGHIGRQLGLPQNQQQIVVYAALLHDIGAASNWNEKQFIVHHDNDIRVFNHAEQGYDLLKDSTHLCLLADPIRYHHDRFCGGNPSGLVGDGIPLFSRILHVADRIEIQIDNSRHILHQRDEIIAKLAGSHFFDPKILAIIKKLNQSEAFWLDIVNNNYTNSFLGNQLNFTGKLMFNMDDMIAMAGIFAQLVDASSPFTAAHSRNVAKVSRALAGNVGFSELESNQIYLAGLMHDLGKLSVPNEILNKPGKLDPAESAIIRQHSYYSYRILQEVEGLEVIAAWVGCHHETLDGNGYPFKLQHDQISLGSRILTIADIYCALAESRPYRAGMSLEQIITTLEEMERQQKLEPKLVAEIKRHGEHYLAQVDRLVI